MSLVYDAAGARWSVGAGVSFWLKPRDSCEVVVTPLPTAQRRAGLHSCCTPGDTVNVSVFLSLVHSMPTGQSGHRPEGHDIFPYRWWPRYLKS